VVPGSGKIGWRERGGRDGIGDGWRGEEVLMVNLSVDGFVFEDVIVMGYRMTKDAGLKEEECWLALTYTYLVYLEHGIAHYMVADQRKQLYSPLRTTNRGVDPQLL
jgi:hypothetical protein